MSNGIKNETGGLRPGRRGRPTASRIEEIEQAILAAARTRFLSEGYAATAMEVVASEAGVSKGTLYSRYPTKAALFEAIVADRLKAWSLVARGPAVTVLDLEGRLLQRARSLLEGFSIPEVRAFSRLLTAESERFPELAREFYEHGFRSAIEHTREDIVAAWRPGCEGHFDASAVASVFCSALLGWYRTESLFREIGRTEREAYARQTVAFTLRGLGLD